jgi:hypothetical protein
VPAFSAEFSGYIESLKLQFSLATLRAAERFLSRFRKSPAAADRTTIASK